jgi:MFS transporter, MFS domain-containing protein family, molybdate-anion transporter
MYLFVFIWVPVLQEASNSPSTLPLGYIFSIFMVFMMLGSLLYSFLITHWYRFSSKRDLLTLHIKLSAFVCGVSSVAFAICIKLGSQRSFENERARFWSFCAFEFCVGMYYPVQGFLRSLLIPNVQRATVSSSLI